MRLRFTQHARSQFEQTVSYIFNSFGRKVAVNFVQKFRNDVNLLLTSPYMAKKEPLLEDYPSEYRSFMVTHINKVVYRIIDDEVVEISALWDMRRNPDNLVKTIIYKKTE